MGTKNLRRQQPGKPVAKRKEASRARLLHAAERLIIESGIGALSIRRIAAASGLNSQLIGYYFGGLDQMVEELLWLNLDPITDHRQELLAAIRREDRKPGVDDVLEAFLRPMWREAAFSKGVHANIVIAEIVTNGPHDLRDRMMAKIKIAYHELADAFEPLLPHISHSTLLWRICCISGSVIAVTPRLYTPAFFSPLEGDLPEFTDEQWYRELFAFAKGAIMAPPAN